MFASAASLIFVAAAFYPLSKLSHADTLDAWWLAARFTLREKLSPPPAADPDIVMVTVDNRCIANWPEPTVAWNPHFAKAIDRITRSGARVIGMDWLQPNATEQWFPGNDAVLIKALSTSHNVVWVMAANRDLDKFGRSFIPPYAGFTTAGRSLEEDPNDYMGYSEIESDSGVITSASPELPTEAAAVSFAARIVERSRSRHSTAEGSSRRTPGGRAMPLRDNGTMLIDYANGAGRADFGDHDPRRPFATYSMFDVAALPDRPDSRFRDKVVLIGAAFTGNNDQHFVPFLNFANGFGSGSGGLRRAYGVEIQANIVRNLLRGRALTEPGQIGLWMIAIAAGVTGVALFLLLRWLPAALTIVAVCLLWIAASFAVFNLAEFALPVSLPLAALLVSGSLMGGYLALSEERERKQVMGLWGQYQDPRLVAFLLQNPKARGGEGKEMEVTVLFADLKNFTKTVEHLSPANTIAVLNRYLGMLNSVIRSHGGIVDKYLGDGLMAQWGAPDTPDAIVPDHAAAAVRACLEIQKQACALVAMQEEGDGPAMSFELRLTLHTGCVVFGWVGAQRLELTIIGDIVNVTSRLQETAKQLEVDFLISESTFQRVQDEVVIGQQAEVAIRGRDRPLRVYEIVGRRQQDDALRPAAATTMHNT